jgi:hypothetical protein
VQLAVGDDRMIEDLLIWKIVAEHPIFTRANSNPAFVIVCAIALVGPGPGFSTQAESYKCGDGLDERLKAVSAQQLRRLSRSIVISLPLEIRISSDSPFDCLVWYFYYGQVIESKDATKH